jgi:hypothetical protein
MQEDVDVAMWSGEALWLGKAAATAGQKLTTGQPFEDLRRSREGLLSLEAEFQDESK